MDNIQAHSSYVVQREPDKYGGQQDAYTKRALEMTSKAVVMLKQGVQQGSDPKKLFHQTLDLLAIERQKIAADHKTKNGELFGKRRDKDLTSSLTPLGGPAYSEYNKKLISKMQAQLKAMKYNAQTFKEKKEAMLPNDKALGRKFTSLYQIYSENNNEWLFPSKVLKDYKIYKQVYAACKGSTKSICTEEAYEDNEVSMFNELFSDQEGMLKVKKSLPDIYNRMKMQRATRSIKNSFSNAPISRWVKVTDYLEVNGEMYELSQYLTWMEQALSEDPVDQMSEKSIVSIVHQDPFLIDCMMKEMAKIFKKTLQWNGKDIKNLKQRVALLQYEFAHAMPYCRGSAAIGEWLESIIYSYHGFKLAYNPNKMVNLEALTSSLKEFADHYDSMVELEKIAAQ